jgi:hypothetical protein
MWNLLRPFLTNSVVNKISPHLVTAENLFNLTVRPVPIVNSEFPDLGGESWLRSHCMEVRAGTADQARRPGLQALFQTILNPVHQAENG